LGLTGHHDPAILLEAMRRFAFDTVLVAVNAADRHRLPFLSTVVAEAARQTMGVIAMKVTAQGRLLTRLSMTDAFGYVLSQPGVSLAIVGCETPEEVADNVRIASKFTPLADDRLRQLEECTLTQAALFGYFKKS
jgi:predicted aldo/keto reductase-like oxidoreductase